MRNIHWNNKAKLDYFKNIDFLLEKWSEKVAQDFIDEVFEVEFILSQGNIDFQDTDFVGVKRFVIRKQITLFIELLTKRTLNFYAFGTTTKTLTD